MVKIVGFLSKKKFSPPELLSLISVEVTAN